MLLDQLAQCVDGRAGRLERDRIHAGTRAAGREPCHLDRDQREQPAHRDSEAGAREKALLVQLHRTAATAACAVGLAERHDRLGRRAP